MSDIIPITKPSSAASPTTKQETKYPTEMVDLPSKGYFYPEGHPLSSGQIELKMMTAKEEDILTSANLLKKGIVLDKLLEALIVDKSVNINEMLLVDKDGIYISIRRLAYGDNYGPLSITCPRCGKDTKNINVNLAEIKNDEFNFSKYQRGKNSFDLTLPQSKRTITYKLLTHKDEKEIESEIEGLNKINKQSSSELTTRLKKIITSVDGVTDVATIRKFVDMELRAGDSLALRKAMKETSPNVDMTFNFTCGNSECNHEERTVVPLTTEFFWPKA